MIITDLYRGIPLSVEAPQKRLYGGEIQSTVEHFKGMYTRERECVRAREREREHTARAAT